jgi:hypothetical protein
LDVSWNDSIDNEDLEHLSTMKNLKSLDVRYIGELSSSSVSKLKNLTTLKIGKWIDKLDDLFLEHLTNLKDLHVSYFLTDKGMKFLGKIEKLAIYECNKISDESFKYLKRVKDLMLIDMQQLTTKVIKILSKTRNVMESIAINKCDNLENEDDWRREMRIKNLIINWKVL